MAYFSAGVFLTFLGIADFLNGEAEHLHILKIDEPMLLLKCFKKVFLVVFGFGVEHILGGQAARASLPVVGRSLAQ